LTRDDWVLLVPMRMEARALRRGLPSGAPLRRTGRGLVRAGRAADRHSGAGALAVAGIAGGLTSALRPGDVVVATEVRRADRPDAPAVPCPAAPMVAAALRRRGLTAHLGPVVTSRRLVDGPVRARLAATGALAADTESAALLGRAAGRPVICVRVVADVPPQRLYRPLTWRRVRAALRVLPEVAPVLVEWAAATTADDVVLAAPRSCRAGAAGAVGTAERAPVRPGPSAGVHRPRGIAAADVVLVLGPAHSPTSRRLVEVAERGGTPAYLVDDVDAVDLRWLAGVRTIGVAAGTAAPPRLVDETVAALAGLGAGAVRGPTTWSGDVYVTHPEEVRTP